MRSAAKAIHKPRLLYEAQVQRRRYWRECRRAFLLMLVALLALAALEVARARDAADPLALDIGRLAAAFLAGLLLVRVVVSFIRWRTRPDERIRVYDQGFTWQRGGETHKYSWGKLAAIREGGRGLYLGQRPLVQWGAHTLTMADKEVFRFRPYHGDMRAFIRAVRPYAADVTGTRMGRILRQEKPVRLHPKLVAWPGGLAVGKKELPWATLDVDIARQRLIIRARAKNGRYKTVRSYPVSAVDNVAGFYELATTTIENHK